MLSGIMLSVICSERRKKALSADFHYDECHYAECRGATVFAFMNMDDHKKVFKSCIF